MVKVQMSHRIPNLSMIAENLDVSIDYLDSFSVCIDKGHEYSIDYLTALVFTSFPSWVNILMAMRNTIVRPFGLETAPLPTIEKVERDVRYDKGDRAVFFTVSDRSKNEIVMGEEDKHLIFRTSVLMTEEGDESQRIHLTTLVHFNNIGGKIYFTPVKPFHKIIVKSLLRRFAQRLSNEN